MTKAKFITGIVRHPKVYKMVDGKLQHVPKGTEIAEMTEEQITRSRGKIIAKTDAKKLVVGAAEADLKAAQAALDAVKPPAKK